MSPEEIQLVELALSAMGQVFGILQEQKAGNISATDALARMQDLHSSLAQGNAAADAAEDAKFPVGHVDQSGGSPPQGGATKEAAPSGGK